MRKLIHRQERVAVVGGGMIGMTGALRLAQAGCEVELFETRDHLGGLSDSYTWHDVTWDRFYHVVLSTDTILLNLIRELGLDDELVWRDTRSGFYRDGRLVSISSMGDFVAFPFLSLWQKFRLGMGILLSTRIKDVDKLDRIFVREWLTRVFGRRVYERFWDPLLRSKLGEARHRTSAAFMWATISRLYGARSGESKTEKMGYVRGGYARILSALEKALGDANVMTHLSSRVDAVGIGAPREAQNDGITITANGENRHFDKALVTGPAPEVLRLAAKGALGDEYRRGLEEVSYLGVICLLLILDRPLSPYYVTNLLDKSLPFTGIIEATNIVDPAEVGNKHLVYLPKYVTQDDSFNELSDDEVRDLYLAGLRKVHPEFSEDWILHVQLFRERYVQPLQEVNCLDRVGGVRTSIQGLFVANSTMLYNSTLNNNAAIGLAEKTTETMLGELSGQPAAVGANTPNR